MLVRIAIGRFHACRRVRMHAMALYVASAVDQTSVWRRVWSVVERHRRTKPNSSIELKTIPNAEEEKKVTLSRMNQASGASTHALNNTQNTTDSAI